jgi:hypothetical protein
MSNWSIRTIASREVTFTHGRLWTLTKPNTRGQHERSNRALREVSEDTARARHTTVARGNWDNASSKTSLHRHGSSGKNARR